MKKRVGKRGTLTVLVVLQVLVVLTIVAEAFHRNFYNIFLCVLTLLLFNIPRFLSFKLNIKLPSVLEIVILLFIFAAEILGEIQDFYTIFPHWDVMLHTINGFIMAAIGFAMIDIINQDPRFHIIMSPFFVAFVAFCFSMTIGVLWEFFEFGMDSIFGFDMQKDTVIQSVNSVLMNPSVSNSVYSIKGIENTVINSVQDGVETQYIIEGGYVDIGIVDTMKDLIVNCLGAVIFSIIGIFYIKKRGNGRVAESFIPQMKTAEEIEQTKIEIKNLKSKRRKKYEKIKSIHGVSNDSVNNIDSVSGTGG